MISSETKQRKIVGMIGTGLMGSAFASNLLSKGYEVHVFNRTKAKTEPLKAKGAIVHDSPEELASKVQIVITSLTDHNAIDQVAVGESGFLKKMNKDSLWIDMSTIDPDASIRHHEEAKKEGINRLDAPVSGGPVPAAKGEIMILAGGSQEVLEKYEGFLNDLAKIVVYLGPGGSGHKMKLVVNLYLGLVAESFSEALVFSNKLGFQPKAFVDTINKTNHKNGFSEGKGPKVAEGTFNATFSLNNLLKDLRLASEQARKTNATLPVTRVAIEQFAEASKIGNGEKDFSAVAIQIAGLNGISLEKNAK